MGLLAADAPAGGGACKNSVTCATTCWRVNFSAGSEIGACEVIFRRGFHRKVDWREELLLVCSSAVMEVVGKSRQQKLLTAWYSDDGLTSVRLCEDCSMTGL